MGHSQSVHYKCYEKLGGQNKAALALKVRQRLASDKSNADEPKQQSELEGSSNEPPKKHHWGGDTRFHKTSEIQWCRAGGNQALLSQEHLKNDFLSNAFCPWSFMHNDYNPWVSIVVTANAYRILVGTRHWKSVAFLANDTRLSPPSVLWGKCIRARIGGGNIRLCSNPKRL